MAGPVEVYQKQLGFRVFRSFGSVCDKSERAVKEAAKKTSITKQLSGQSETEKKEPENFQMSAEQQFKIGVGWWSELFVFYGILTAIAVWEIRRFNNMRKEKERRITSIQTKQEYMFQEIDKLERRIG